MTPTTFAVALLLLVVSVVFAIGGLALIVVGRKSAWRHQPVRSVVLQSLGLVLIAGVVIWWLLSAPMLRGAL